jgi:hypothetical protein
MTSPSLLSEPAPPAIQREQGSLYRIGLPVLFFLLTMLTTSSVGMRYMHNFQAGLTPLADDADILPYVWVAHNLHLLWTGLPFSLTLVGILLAHEFGHYFACRCFAVRATLPYLLPAPSLSGTFGAVIRLKSIIRSRSALIVIGASGPIAGFVVAVATVTLGLSWSTYSTTLIVQKVQPPLIIFVVHALMQSISGHRQLSLIVPHPVLIASWIGLLITALNLIPAGQLDGGHILYAISPDAHRWTSRFVIAALFVLGIFCWAGWILWGIILMMPGMRHPRIPDPLPIARWQYALVPVSLLLLVFCGTFEPFSGYGLADLYLKFRGH